jgi:non-homologous end joining protein Ku
MRKVSAKLTRCTKHDACRSATGKLLASLSRERKVVLMALRATWKGRIEVGKHPLSVWVAKHAHDTFDPTAIHNQHNEALHALAMKKAKRKQGVVHTGVEVGDEEESSSAETVDLMRMLKQSLKRG